MKETTELFIQEHTCFTGKSAMLLVLNKGFQFTCLLSVKDKSFVFVAVINPHQVSA